MISVIDIPTPSGVIVGRAAGQPNHPLVLGIHGWSQRNGWHTWEPLIEPLAAAGLWVISLDMPGWGDSSAWEKTAGKSAVAAVLDSLKIDSALAIMGKSWGGGVALEFALAFPGRVQKLILTAPAYRGTKTDLERLTQPVLLAWAEDDPVIPLVRSRFFADHLPTCQLEIYPTGGHSAAMNNAADFAPKAREFLVKSDQ